MHETVDTTMTSRRLSSELVVECRSRSTSALTERVLLDEGVGLRHVGLWLVVVVVRDEVLDGVVGHELAELVRELGGQGLVVGEHERGPLHLLDEPGRRRRLAGSGGTEQHDVGLAGVDAPGELGDGRRLITARRVLADDLERAHGTCRLHAFESRFDHRHTPPALCAGGGQTDARGAARRHRAATQPRAASSSRTRAQSASVWLTVCPIVPSVSTTTSAIASRWVSEACESMRACACSSERPRISTSRSARVSLRGVGHDDEVERMIHLGLDEQRHVVHHDGARVRGLGRGEQPGGQRAHLGVHDGIEPLEGRGIREHQLAQSGSIERAIGGENTVAEAPRESARDPRCRARRPCGPAGRRRCARRRARRVAARWWISPRRCRQSDR